MGCGGLVRGAWSVGSLAPMQFSQVKNYIALKPPRKFLEDKDISHFWMKAFPGASCPHGSRRRGRGRRRCWVLEHCQPSRWRNKTIFPLNFFPLQTKYPGLIRQYWFSTWISGIRGEADNLLNDFLLMFSWQANTVSIQAHINPYLNAGRLSCLNFLAPSVLLRNQLKAQSFLRKVCGLLKIDLQSFDVRNKWCWYNFISPAN